MVAAWLALAGMTDEADALFFKGGGALPTNSQLTQANFTLTNWGGSTSPGYVRIGMPFKSGDVPAGATVQIWRTISGVFTQIAAQFDQRAYYTSADLNPGSLMFAVCTIRDTSFSASEVRTYTPVVVPSSSWNNTGTKTLTDITAHHSFQVQCTNVGELNNVWSGKSTTTVNGQVSGTTFTVNSITTGTAVIIGSVLTGTGVVANQTILSQLTGPTGGAGTYQVSISQTATATENITCTYDTIVASNTTICGPRAGVSGLKDTATIQLSSSGGTSAGGSQPTWNTTIGGTTTDGSVTWTNIAASSNPNTYNGGTLTIDFNSILTATTSGQATRLTKIHSGPVCETWMAWGMATTPGAVADAHLKGYVYVTIWKDGTGAIADYEFACTVSQDWWTTANKFALSYNASLVDTTTSTTYLTYNNIVHPYQSQWFTGSAAGNNNDGRRFWVNQMPTIGYQPSQSYWVSTVLVPPLWYNYGTITYATNNYAATTYTPCVNINCNSFIDNTGGSNGRGIFMDSDSRAFLTQNQTDVKAARLTGFSGMGVPYHYRSNANRTRVQDGGVSDIGSCPMPLNMGAAGGTFPSFTSVGLPASVDAYAGAGTSAGNLGGYVTPTGGQGVWVKSTTSSHASTYCFFTYLLEGERHFLECLMDLAQNSVQGQQAAGFQGILNLPFEQITNYKTAFSIPTTLWHGILPVYIPGNTRSSGWALVLGAIAAAVTPATDALGNVTPEASYFDTLLATATRFMATAVNSPYMPASQLAAGWWVDDGSGPAIVSQWMHDFIVIGAGYAYLTTSDANAQTMVNFLAKQPIGLTNAGPYHQAQERSLAFPAAPTVWNSSTNDYFPIADCYVLMTDGAGSVATNGNITMPGINTISSHSIQVGDLIIFTGVTGGGYSACPVPAELTIGVAYYVLSSAASGANQIITISSTPGAPGSVQTFSTTYTGCTLFWFGSNLATTPANSTIYMPQSDSYPAIARAALAYAKLSGVSGAAAALSTMQTFMAPADLLFSQNNGFEATQYYGWFMNA